MGTPHKHRDVIIAWANGEEIESFVTKLGMWQPCEHPVWTENCEYRIKPKRVKKEGWVNVYNDTCAVFYPTKAQADETYGCGNRKACIRIEWEEEA